jgi:hypothetical protein
VEGDPDGDAAGEDRHGEKGVDVVALEGVGEVVKGSDDGVLAERSVDTVDEEDDNSEGWVFLHWPNIKSTMNNISIINTLNSNKTTTYHSLDDQGDWFDLYHLKVGLWLLCFKLSYLSISWII